MWHCLPYFLYNEIPVICVVFSPSSSKTISAVANTWGQHCNALHFYYSTFRLKSLKGNLKKRGKDADSILIFNHTTSQNKLLKEKVYVTDVPEAKSEFALLCRAFHNIKKMYIYSKQVKHKIPLQYVSLIIHRFALCIIIYQLPKYGM